MSDQIVDGVIEAIARIDAQMAMYAAAKEQLIGVLVVLRLEGSAPVVAEVPVADPPTPPSPALRAATVPRVRAERTKGVPAKAARAKPAPASKPAPKPSSPSSPSSSKIDYHAIADEIGVLRAAGRPVSAGLAAKFRVPETTTRNWLTKCRTLGLIGDAKDPPMRVVEDDTGPVGDPVQFDAGLVAETYLAAFRANRKPVQAVADRFNIDREGATGFIARARAEGALEPAGSPQLPAAERREILDAYKPEPAA